MTDWSYRNKRYTARVTVRSLPIDESGFPRFRQLMDFVRQRQDVTVVIEIENSDDYQELRLSCTGEAYYLDITYPMDEFGWEHPLILADDRLTAAEAEEVLRSILVDENDQTDIIMKRFRQVSGFIYGD